VTHIRQLMAQVPHRRHEWVLGLP